MATVNVSVSSEDSEDCKPTRVQILRGLVAEKLSAAAQEIFAEVERTVSGLEEEAAGLRQQVDRQEKLLEALLQPRVTLCRTDEDSGGPGVFGHAEEPVQSISPDLQDLRDPGQNRTERRVRSVKGRTGGHVNLRVCLLQDSHHNLLRGVLKTPVQEVRCPRGLQEPDFLDLLRSTFPQLSGRFDAFTANANKKLKPLKLKTLTAEEIQKSIRSTGKGRSALYIRLKETKKSQTCTERLCPEEKDEAAAENGRRAGSHRCPGQNVDGTRDDRMSRNSGRRQDKERRGGETEGGDEDDEDGDDEWKPDKNDEELRERDAEHSGVKTKRQKPLKAATDSSDALLSCKVCRALRRSTSRLIKHARSHVDDPERRCGVCGEHLESADELRSHLRGHQRRHSCDVCGKSFLSGYSLDRHALTHTGEKPYKCDVCDKSFYVKHQLRIHSRTHTGEKPYRCDVCSKSVSDSRCLSRHKLIHTGDKQHGCQVCGKRFLTRGKAKEHEKTHTERDKAYLCDVCCKMFRTQGQLTVHLRTHAEEKVACRECGVRLSCQSALKRHMTIHTGERPYECSECGRTFRGMTTLRAHLKLHSGIKQFVCAVCGAAFARKEYLKVHTRTHNGEKPYKCLVCEKAFTQSHCLKTHMKSHREDGQSAVDGLQS